MRIPRHLAIIMDGNGRWAEQRHLPRIVGHQRGVETVRSIVEECCRLNVPYLTLYAFSSENWGRPETEVNALMELLARFLLAELQQMESLQIRLNVIGEIDRLPPGVQTILTDAMEQTKQHKGLVLTLALSYGARNELVRSCRQLAIDVAAGRLNPEEIDESLLGNHLDTRGMPDPDFLIRTSGEMRISNFLLWQLAYTELYFTEVLWPEFSIGELHQALNDFGTRQRRFGLTAAQLDSDLACTKEGDH